MSTTRATRMVMVLALSAIVAFAANGCGLIKVNLTSSSQPNAGGSVNPAKGTYERGIAVDVAAVPSAGYRFDHWEGSASGSSPTAHLVMDGNKEVVAYFTRVFALSLTSAPPSGGTVNPPNGTYDEGKAVTLIATPSKDYTFNGWGGDSSGSSDRITVTMNSNKTIVASFAKITYALQAKVDSSGGGTVEPTSGKFEAGTDAKVTAVALPGYRFNRWDGSVSSTSNPLSIRMDTNKSVAAVFTKVYSLTVTASPDGSGSVKPDKGVYDVGTKVPLVSTALFPYAFSRWEGADSNSSAATVVTMNSDKSPVAYFTKLNPGSPQKQAGMYTGREVRLPVTLKAGQWVRGGFISDSMVNIPLRIMDPAFGLVQDLGYSLNATFTFQAQVSGDYYVDIPYTFAFSTSNYTVTYAIYS